MGHTLDIAAIIACSAGKTLQCAMLGLAARYPLPLSDCLLLQLQDALLFAARLLAARASSWGGGRASGGWL